jgi:EKC/KEOPS complex subunit CGI121/TPRKB
VLITAADMQVHLDTEIRGEQVPFDDHIIAEMTDLTRVRKIYKLNGGGGKKNIILNATSKRNEEAKEMEIFILGSIALRGATN